MSSEPTSKVSTNSRTPKIHFEWFWNFLTFLILLGLFSMTAYFVFIYSNPASPYNFFPPPTMPVAVVIPTDTPIPPSATVTLTETPTYTPTKYQSPTWTIPPSFTPTFFTETPTLTMVPTDTITFTPAPTLTPKPNSLYPFMLQSLPAAMSASVFISDRGCDWMGVAGRVVDLQNRPATGITIQLVGTLNRKYIEQTSLTGTALAYGPSGYEFSLSDQPISSAGLLSIRLLDQAGLLLSEKVIFDTYVECDKNLVLINFKQVR